MTGGYKKRFRRKKMKKAFSIILALFMVVFVLTGCSGQQTPGGSASPAPSVSSPASSVSSAPPSPAQGPVQIAGCMTVTGALSTDGDQINKGIQLAVAQANAKGGVLGREVEYIIEDAGSTPDTALNAINRIIVGNYDVIFGPHFSAQVLAMTDILNDAGQLNIFGGTNARIMGELTNPYSVRCRVPDRINARAVAVFVGDQGAKKVGLLTVSDDFGQGARNIIEEYFNEIGLEFVSEIFNTEDRDFTTQLLNIRNAGVDAMILWGLGDTPVLIARQMFELGMSKLLVMSSGVNTTPEHRARMEPEWYDGWYANSQWNPTSTDPLSVAFNKDYEEFHGSMPNFLAAAWYSTTLWYLDCVEKAGSTDKDAVLEVMKKTNDFPALNGNYTWRDRDLCNQIIIVQTPADGSINNIRVVEG